MRAKYPGLVHGGLLDQDLTQELLTYSSSHILHKCPGLMIGLEEFQCLSYGESTRAWGRNPCQLQWASGQVNPALQSWTKCFSNDWQVYMQCWVEYDWKVLRQWKGQTGYEDRDSYLLPHFSHSSATGSSKDKYFGQKQPPSFCGATQAMVIIICTPEVLSPVTDSALTSCLISEVILGACRGHFMGWGFSLVTISPCLYLSFVSSSWAPCMILARFSHKSLLVYKHLGCGLLKGCGKQLLMGNR
jgi:hypothetical protein